MSPLPDPRDRALASSASGGEDDLERRVRARLRALRHERALTLAEASAAAGMDPSALSRLESGARRLTLAHLPPLARALGVTVDDLLARGAAAPAARATPYRMRDGVVHRPVAEPAADGMRTARLLLPSERREPAPRAHAGHEWIHVLSGRLRLVLGDEERVLAPGEAAQFSTWTPHWSGVVDEPVELLVTFRP